jgi:hypothetical protein
MELPVHVPPVRTKFAPVRANSGADAGPGFFLSSLFLGEQQSLDDLSCGSAIPHQLPQGDGGFDAQKYLDALVCAGLLLCAALGRLDALDASVP